MQNGSIYQRKSDGRWVAQYRDADGKSRYLYRKTKSLAKAALREALKDKDDGVIPSKLKVKDILTSWVEVNKTTVSERTLEHRQYLIRSHISSHSIANRKLSELNQDRIRSYLNSKKQLAPSTRNRLLAIMRFVGSEAVRLRTIRHNPTDGIRPFNEVREMEILTPNQIKQLLESIKGHRYETVVVLGAACGIRVGEALGACWEDIDFDKGTIQIKRTVWKSKVYPPKTKTSRRTLKLPQKALETLERHRNGSGYLVTTASGNPSTNANFHPIWKKMLVGAELPRDTTFHSLRHGAASILLNQNVPIPVVSKYLGHSNPSTTMRIYAHTIDGMNGIAAR